MSTLDFWFDFSSPFAYLASTQVDALAARTGATLRWRPMLLGAVFNAVGQVNIPISSFSDAKRAWYARDLQRWADQWRVPFVWSPIFPLRTVLPLRAFLAHPDPIPFAHRVYAAAWAEGRDIANPAVLRACGASEAVLAAAPDQKAALFAETEEALRIGVFGAPSFIVDGRHLFWGQDRLGMVERALRGWVPPG